LAASVIDWPLSIVGAKGLIAPADRAAFTVTPTAEEAVATGDEELSVTWSSKCHVPVPDKAPVEMVGHEEVVQPTVNEEPKSL
jgi:hypothetical protein